ncbi:hypothetical protein J2J97_31965 (plasmid) [Rhizobium bangladeshense]|nr:hypothetical protein [Rhizobium bangladeshense]QSY98689.1 hypothetical protein J2J97_31965 [Rhizobium bangladeshense]
MRDWLYIGMFVGTTVGLLGAGAYVYSVRYDICRTTGHGPVTCAFAAAR